MAEQAVVNASHRLLRARGAWYYNVPGNPTGETGIPDDIICYRGRFLALEYKAPRRGRVRPKQRFHIERIERAGGIAIVARSADDVRAALDQIDAEVDEYERLAGVGAEWERGA